MPSRKDRRPAARARATAVPAWPRPDTRPDEPEEETSGGDAGLAARVIPPGIFDPFEEARKPW